MRNVLVGLMVAATLGLAAPAAAKPPRGGKPAPLTMQTVNDAAPPQRGRGKGPDPLTVKAAVLLDRARFSPGVIDGRPGENLDKAIKAFQAAQEINPDGKLEGDTWARLAATSADPALVEHEIAAEDVKGPFLEKLPAKMEDMQGLKRLGYTSAREALAEKFHMSEALLRALNPKADFEKAGTKLVVANVPRPAKDPALKGKVARIEVDKEARTLMAFDADGKLVAFHPASVGSEEKPAPSGSTEIRAVAENPTYTYNPEYGFKGVKAEKKFTIAAGPNNPVGAAWIDLAIESYGIHGTPEPEKVGKSYSHGCVRLTNWGVKELAAMVRKGTVVEFKD